MDALFTLDGITFHISTTKKGDIEFAMPSEFDDSVTLSPAAVQLLSEALQFAVYEARNAKWNA